jgi:predicted metal-dependent peptidase
MMKLPEKKTPADGLRDLENSIIRLLKVRPFYGQFLLQCRRMVVNGEAPAGATMKDGIATLAINPQVFALFSTLEQQALLEHLVKHLLHLHPSRRRKHHQRNWDLACDLAINDAIENLPAEAPHPRRFHFPEQLAAEEYYARLPQIALPDADKGQGEDSAGRATQDTASLRPIDDHQLWQEGARTPLALAEQVVRHMVQTSLRHCHHEVPSELKHILKPYLQPPTIPWQQVLRQFVGTVGRTGKNNTWKRSHRRFGQITPGIRKTSRLNLLIAVDVSDSTNQQAQREMFANELVQIARGRTCQMTIIYTGSRIQKIEQFNQVPQAVEVYQGGGYTDLRPAFTYADQMQPRPAALIYLTDGFGPAPEKTRIPTLWVLTATGRKPADWGVELRLPAMEKGMI